MKLAEREGFEPSVPLRARLISSQVQSTTLPPLRMNERSTLGVPQENGSRNFERTARWQMEGSGHLVNLTEGDTRGVEHTRNMDRVKAWRERGDERGIPAAGNEREGPGA